MSPPRIESETATTNIGIVTIAGAAIPTAHAGQARFRVSHWRMALPSSSSVVRQTVSADALLVARKDATALAIAKRSFIARPSSNDRATREAGARSERER